MQFFPTTQSIWLKVKIVLNSPRHIYAHFDPCSGLGQLSRLDLSQSGLGSIPGGDLCALTALTHLNLSANRLQDVADLGLQLTNTACSLPLGSLDLSGIFCECMKGHGTLLLNSLFFLILGNIWILSILLTHLNYLSHPSRPLRVGSDPHPFHVYSEPGFEMIADPDADFYFYFLFLRGKSKKELWILIKMLMRIWIQIQGLLKMRIQIQGL